MVVHEVRTGDLFLRAGSNFHSVTALTASLTNSREWGDLVSIISVRPSRDTAYFTRAAPCWPVRRRSKGYSGRGPEISLGGSSKSARLHSPISARIGASGRLA